MRKNTLKFGTNSMKNTFESEKDKIKKESDIKFTKLEGLFAIIMAIKNSE